MTLNDIVNNQLIQIGFTLLVAMVVQTFSHTIIERLVRRAVQADRFETKLDEKKREDTVINIFRTSFTLVLWTIIICTILSILRVHLAALLTGAGLFGVIFGLGAQNTIKDYLAGIYILTENQYRVGDIVSLSGGVTSALGTSGVVEEITLRVTKLRDMDGTLNIVRNGDAGIITNRTNKYSSVVIDMGVAYGSDLAQVETVMNEVGKAMLSDEKINALVIEPMKFLRVENFTDSGVSIKALGKVKPAAQWEVASEFRKRILVAFKQHHIGLAMQQRVVHTAAPHNIQKSTHTAK